MRQTIMRVLGWALVGFQIPWNWVVFSGIIEDAYYDSTDELLVMCLFSAIMVAIDYAAVKLVTFKGNKKNNKAVKKQNNSEF